MLSDLKLALRWLRNSPGFTAIAVISLALAIGANAAIFSVADAVLFRPLPYHEPDRLLTVRMLDRSSGERYTFIAADLVESVGEMHGGVGEVARLEDGQPLTHEGPDGLRYVETAAVTANYFQVLGVRAHRGRIFGGASEDAGARVAMLSYNAWRDAFGGDESIVGRPLALGGQTLDVVGVLPPGFVFPPSVAGSPELVTVLAGSIGENSNARNLALRSGAAFPIVRLEPGVTVAQAQSELEAIHAGLGTGRGESVPVFEDLRSVLHQTGAPIMRYMLAGSLLLLLLGCANLANLLLARGQRRLTELGVRSALGASRIRLVRPILLEAVVLGISGSAVALVVARLTFDQMIGSVPPEALAGQPVGLDGRVLAFTMALGIASAILFGIMPTLRAARADARSLIHGHAATGAPRAALGGPLVAVQVAIALVLVFGASISGRALVSLLRQPLGFTPDNVLTATLAIPGARGLAEQDAMLRLIESVSQEPGVVSAGATASLPRIRPNAWAAINRPGTEEYAAEQVLVLPGYLETAGIRIVAGRTPEREEVRAGARVAVVSERAARALFPSGDALGSSFDDREGKPWTVIGIAGDVQQRVSGESQPTVYTPPHELGRTTTIVVRLTARSAAAEASVRRRLAAELPGTVVATAWWTDRINALAAYRNPRFQSIVLGSFAAIALGLTALGVFGLVSVMVATRTREIGIRMALGSTPGAVVAHVVRRSLAPVAVGGVAGLVATRWLAQLAEAQLYEVDTRDPLVLAIACALVLLAGLAAAWIPSRRAGRVDPVVVLRAE